jgi:hypothetical protein
MSTSAKDSTPRAEPKSDSRPATAAASPSQAKDASPGAGRIVHDSRGNAVWNWDSGSDPSSTASTSKMLRKLDLSNLRVEDAAQPEKDAGPKKPGSGYGPGYNPYDRTSPVRGTPRKGPSRG